MVTLLIPELELYMLSKEAVLEWKKIYETTMSLEISFDEATERANRMFRFLATITKPNCINKLNKQEGGVNNDKNINSPKS